MTEEATEATMYTYEGRDFPVWHFPDTKSVALLSDLYRVHGIPVPVTPEDNIFERDGLGGIIWDHPDNPGGSFVVLDYISVRCPLWPEAVRFREWVLATVLPDSPYFQLVLLNPGLKLVH